MTISLSTIPNDIRVPGQYLEVDASKAVPGTSAAAQRILLIGQRLAGSTVAALVPTLIVSAAQAARAFGVGSMLAQMAEAAKAANDETECWAIALDDLVAGTAAVRTITIVGTATGPGTFALRICDAALPIAVDTGDTPTVIAARIAAAVTARKDVPYTATADTGVVTMTSIHKGTHGNDIDVRVNYFQGEQFPPGVAWQLVRTTSGAGNPDLGTVWPVLGDTRYSTIATPYTDGANLASIEAELASRWGPMRQLEAMAYTCLRQTLSGATTLGATRNSPYVSILPMLASPTPSWRVAAAYAATIALYGGIDPARPFQTLPLAGVSAPAQGDRFIRQERELLLRNGMSTYTVQGGVVLLERPVTTFQVDGFGLPSAAFLDVNTPLTLAYLRQSARARVAAKFSRMKLADDGTAFGAGQAIVTPSVIRAELIALAREWEDAGLVENVDRFRADIVVERDAADRSRVNALIPPDLVNQFRVFAGTIQFIL